MMLYAAAFCVSISIFVIAINNIIIKKLNIDSSFKKFLLLIATAFIASVLVYIPIIGGIITIIYSFTGFGILTTYFIKRKTFNKSNNVVEKAE